MPQEDAPKTAPPADRPELSALGCSLLSHLAAWTDARQPLPELLRALGDEYAGRSRGALWRLADRLEAGDPLEQAVAATAGRFPSGMRRQLRLAAEAGDLATVLPALAAQEAGRRSVRRQVVSTLLYPVAVFGFSLAIALFSAVTVIPQFRAVFDEFELELPAVTEFVIQAAQGTPGVLAGAGAAAAIAAAAWITPGVRRYAHWLATSPPLFGTLWVWVGHQALCEQLALYLATHTPLPTALRGAAAGLGDRNLGRAVALLAEASERGAPLSDAMSRSIHLERPLTTLVRWGERSDTLAETFAEASGRYREQIDQYLGFLQRVAAPCMIFVVGSTLFVVVAALMIPLVKLIEGLT